jgi:hypothetical protein
MSDTAASDPDSASAASASDPASASAASDPASASAASNPASASAAASAAAAAAFVKASAIVAKAKDFVTNNNGYMIGIVIAIALVAGIIIFIIYSKVNQKQNEIKSTYVITNNTIKSLNTIKTADADIVTMPLRNFYIKTALNCCCLGEWKNDYVDVIALQSAIAQGYRCLDFEIYSQDNKPVVAASTKNSFYYKETYNSIPFSDAMYAVAQNAFNPTKTPNGTDPLFIYLRIKSNNPKIIPDIVAAINAQFGGQLLGPDYNYAYNGNNLGQSPISHFVGKVIIITDLSNPLCTDKDLPLFQLINFGSNSPFLHQLQYEMGVKNTPDMDALIDHNKKNMSIVFPDPPFQENINFNIASAFGCQFIGMMPQLKDDNLAIYNAAFDNAGSSFILKPPELCYQPVVIETPPPQNPALSLAGRNYSTDYASWSV